MFFLQKHEVSLLFSTLLLPVAVFGTIIWHKNTLSVCAWKCTFIKSISFLQTFYTKTSFKPFTHQRIQITKPIYTNYPEEDYFHLEISFLTDSQLNDKSKLKSHYNWTWCNICVLGDSFCLHAGSQMSFFLFFAILHSPWRRHISQSITMMPSPRGNNPQSFSDYVSHSGAVPESRGGSEEGEAGRGRPCVFDRSVFVDDLSASPPMLTEVDCAGSSSENSCFWHTHCVKSVCMCVSLGDWLWVFVSVCGWRLWYF